MLKIGLTGGIGSGKTTVARLFEQRSIAVIDADRIAHALVEPGCPALAAIVEQFDEQFSVRLLDRANRLDRTKLREMVFSFPQQRRLLESILHPLVYRAIEQKLAKLDAPYCILCIPLLLETKQQNRVDRILVVDCPVERQIERVIERDRLSSDAARRILITQVSRDQRLSAADDVLCNTSTLAQLDKHVKKLHEFYLSLSEQTGFRH